MMIGVDYHPSFQQIAFLIEGTGEYEERRLNHSDGEAEKYYRDLKLRGVQVRVGMEAPGKRSGSWVKMRINRGQEFVIGGFIPGPHGVDSIIVGYHRGKDLYYVARVRNGFVPATRRIVYEKLKPLITDKCPFVNLSETGRARWGETLDEEKMKKCVWVRSKLVAVVEFLEWTEGDRLRHSKFVALRDDKNPRDVVKEG